jgi:hypothetical protein
MKKIILPIVILSVITACNSKEDKNHSGHKKEIPATKQDSLYEEVMAGHDEVMPKIGKIKGAQKKAQQLIDSIATLPEKAQAAAADLKLELKTLINDLNYADIAMDKWMMEFNMDSMKENINERINYLANEKMKVGKVKEAILSGLQKADSLLKRKL